jgi:RimJ/RimL family protein N-acetyltransferase
MTPLIGHREDVAVLVEGPSPTSGRSSDASVSVRAIRPEDVAGLLAFHAQLSRETTYFRFFNVHPRLSDEEVHRFTHVDHHDREAIVAIHEEQIVGVARFDQLGDGRAEAAFVVRDDWQNRGVGHILITRLAQRAQEEGVQRLVAETMTSNARMLAVFRGAGLVERASFRDGVMWVELDLPGSGELS